MILLSKKISKNFAFEVSLLHKIRDSKDGITFFNANVNLDLFAADHCPKFDFIFIIMNIKILEIEVYNVNHVKKKRVSKKKNNESKT
jgi:hypothetical protein